MTPPPPAPRLAPRAGLLLAALALAASADAATLDVQVVDSGGRALADAVVFLESPAAKAAVRPAANVEISQVNKQFTPAVTVVPVGTPVQFPNRDTVRHHVYSFSPSKVFEIKLYAGKPANPVVFDKPGVAILGCNIHDQMVGWVLVVETPHYGRTGVDGRLKLDDVPAGTYRLRTWHPDLPVGAPAEDQPLQLPASGGAAKVTLPAPGAR